MRSTNLLRRETEQHTVLTFSEPMCCSSKFPISCGLSAKESGVKTGGRVIVTKLQAVRLFFYKDRSSFLLPMLQNLLSMYNFHKSDLINITNRHINLYYHLQISSSLPGHLTADAGGAGQRQTKSLLPQPRLNSSCHQILQ